MEAHEFILQFHQFLKTKQKDFVEHLIKIKVMISRLLETNVIAFGNSWSLDSDCWKPQTSSNPCDIQFQKTQIADKKCEKLRSYPFTQCHHVVLPDPYIRACKYDVCGCTEGSKCLCSAIAAYTKECSEHRVVVEWRTESVFPECSE